MNLIINGTTEIFNNGLTVSDLIKEKNLPESGTAVAINGRLCLKKNWTDTVLKDGDIINLISAAFGG